MRDTTNTARRKSLSKSSRQRGGLVLLTLLAACASETHADSSAWSQDVDVAANDRIRSDDNVTYTLHFYANTHEQSLRDKAKTALDRGIAPFVTEWGTCSADGDGQVNEAETRTWLSFLKSNGISWANWSLNDKPEACSAIKPLAGSARPWRDDQLTPTGCS